MAATTSRLPEPPLPLVEQPLLELVAMQTGAPLVSTHFWPLGQGFGWQGSPGDWVGRRVGVKVRVGVPPASHCPLPSAQCCPSGHELDSQHTSSTQFCDWQSLSTEHSSPLGAGVDRGVGVTVGVSVWVGVSSSRTHWPWGLQSSVTGSQRSAQQMPLKLSQMLEAHSWSTLHCSPRPSSGRQMPRSSQKPVAQRSLQQTKLELQIEDAHSVSLSQVSPLGRPRMQSPS
jgi:hypothetical protein